MVRFEGEDIRTDSDVTELLKKVRSDPRTGNPNVLWINQHRKMIANKEGYPKHMYHPVLSMAVANGPDEEDALRQAGFDERYVPHAYPKFLFRRNMNPKFAKSPEERQRIQSLTDEARRIEMATINQHDFIESIEVKDEVQERKLMASAENKAIGVGKWCVKLTDVPAFEEGPDVDPAVRIAELEGQLAGLREQTEQKRGPGRPPKEQIA